MIKEALRLHRLFQRGFLADSPDFIQEKQHDGRYILAPRKLVAPVAARIAAPIPLVGSITVEGFVQRISPAKIYHYGPFTWQRIEDGEPISEIGQYKVNPAAPYFPYFQAGVDDGGFLIAPNYVFIRLPPDPPDLDNFVKVFCNRDDLAHWPFEMTPGAIEDTADVSSGVFDQTYTFLDNYIFHITITYVH